VANTTTRAILRTRARQLADRENSTFVTDAEINTWIDVSGSELHDILVTRFEDYVETISTINLVAATSDYSLPSDFYKALWVDFREGGRNYTLGRYMNMERNRKQQGSAQLGDLMYRIVGSNIRFIPTPSGSGTVRLGYVPQYVPLAADGTLVSPSIPQGWEEYIVADVTIRILAKDESDPSVAAAIKNGLLQRIELAAEGRDANEPIRVVDVSGRFGRNSEEFGGW
jgi:hypothetical protein